MGGKGATLPEKDISSPHVPPFSLLCHSGGSSTFVGSQPNMQKPQAMNDPPVLNAILSFAVVDLGNIAFESLVQQNNYVVVCAVSVFLVFVVAVNAVTVVVGGWSFVFVLCLLLLWRHSLLDSSFLHFAVQEV
eukprot:1852485-Amphidinium_carterae.1